MENEEHIKAMIREEGDRQKADIRHSLNRLMIKLVCLAVAGAAILALWLYLSATRETVGIEILSIMGWVLVWEATSILILQRPELRRMWLNIDRLTKAEITFQTTDKTPRGAETEV